MGHGENVLYRCVRTYTQQQVLRSVARGGRCSRCWRCYAVRVLQYCGSVDQSLAASDNNSRWTEEAVFSCLSCGMELLNLACWPLYRTHAGTSQQGSYGVHDVARLSNSSPRATSLRHCHRKQICRGTRNDARPYRTGQTTRHSCRPRSRRRGQRTGLVVARKRGKHTRCCCTLGTAFGVAAKEEEGGYGWTTQDEEPEKSPNRPERRSELSESHRGRGSLVSYMG